MAQGSLPRLPLWVYGWERIVGLVKLVECLPCRPWAFCRAQAGAQAWIQCCLIGCRGWGPLVAGRDPSCPLAGDLWLSPAHFRCSCGTLCQQALPVPGAGTWHTTQIELNVGSGVRMSPWGWRSPRI